MKRPMAAVPFGLIVWASVLWDPGAFVGTLRLIAFGLMVGAYVPPVARFVHDLAFVPFPRAAHR